jgi:hypothetical protein
MTQFMVNLVLMKKGDVKEGICLSRSGTLMQSCQGGSPDGGQTGWRYWGPQNVRCGPATLLQRHTTFIAVSVRDRVSSPRVPAGVAAICLAKTSLSRDISIHPRDEVCSMGALM